MLWFAKVHLITAMVIMERSNRNVLMTPADDKVLWVQKVRAR